MRFGIKNRWTGSVQVTAEINCDENESYSVKLGLAVKWAISNSANLSGAYLSEAYLTPIRDDFWAVLSSAPKEVAGLRAALIEGRINGSTYKGECACLVGTIANVRKCGVNDLGSLTPNANRPIERFFLGITPGDKPETHQHSKLALEWLDQWLSSMKGAFGVSSEN